MDNEKRKGRLTSSQAHRVTTPAKFKTLAKEIAVERFIDRKPPTANTQSMKWGSIMEFVLFSEMPLGWSMVHKESLLHHKYGHIWSGTPDYLSKLVCAEAKCFEMKAFGLLAMCIKRCNDSNDYAEFKKEFPKEYWQIVSNCSVSKRKRGMIIAYMPKKSVLLKVIDMVENNAFCEENGLPTGDYFYWFTEDNIEELPYLDDLSDLDSINSFEFEVPQEDIIFLTKKVIELEVEVKRILG